MRIDFVALLVSVILLAPAAQADTPTDSSPSSAENYEQGYSLVYQEARLLTTLPTLLVKGQRREIETVTRDLARTAESIVGELETFAKSRSSIALEDNVLPKVEAGARARMEKGFRRDLLLGTGCGFEKRLLFVEALRAGKLIALIQEMAADARDDVESDLWQGLGEQMTEPLDRVLALLSADCGAP